MPLETFMTSIGTEGHAGKPAQSSPSGRGSEHAVAVVLLLTSSVATLGWIYALSEGAMAMATWLMS